MSLFRRYRHNLMVALFSIVLSEQAFAQNGGDMMRQMGKMYVVIAVIAAIFLGLAYYLFSLDRKLTKLENQIKEDE